MDTKIVAIIAAVIIVVAGVAVFFMLNNNNTDDKDEVTVAVISGDIHQIALHVAIEKGYFDDYGLKVNVSNALNGAEVATSLISGDAKLGFLGAPPATINMVNPGYINSTGVTDASKAYNLLARVNSEGSGLFIKESLIDATLGSVPIRNGVPFYEVNGDVYTVGPQNAAAWGGLIFSTPGSSTIQHVQLLDLANQMGLKTSLYTVGTQVSNDTVYYVLNLANYQQIISDKTVNAGIIWEPQHQRVIQESNEYVELALTNNLFPDHTCCVVAGNCNFADKNEKIVEKFLAGYYDGVMFMQKALSDKSSADYKWLVNFSTQKVANLTSDEVEDALSNITYLYADTANGSLTTLKASVASLIESLMDLGVITVDVQDVDKLVDNYVDDYYLKKALSEKNSLKV